MKNRRKKEEKKKRKERGIMDFSPFYPHYSQEKLFCQTFT
jgi:hypothetical protein